jgi:hypothetical protein
MASSNWMRRKREKEYLGKEVGPKEESWAPPTIPFCRADM